MRTILYALVITLSSSAAFGSDEVLKRIPVGGAPMYLKASADGKRLYVSNALTRAISVIDTSSDTVIGTIPLVTAAGILDAVHMVLAENGSTLFAVDENTQGPGTVNVINLATNAVMAAIRVGERPSDLAIRPGTNELWVVNGNSFSLSIVDTATFQSSTVPVPGYYPSQIVFSPSGATRAYVTRYGAGRPSGLTVFDTDSRLIVGTIESPGSAGEFNPIPSPDGSKLYVTHYNPSSDSGVVLSVIATDTVADVYTRVKTLTGPAATAWMTLTGGGEKAYIVSSMRPTGFVLDTTTDTFVATISLPNPTAHPLWDSEANAVWLPSSGGSVLSVVDAATNALRDALDLSVSEGGAENARSAFLTIAGRKKYVSSPTDGTVIVVGERYGICPLYDQTKAVKAGATIPIKLQVCDLSGANLSSSELVLTATQVAHISSEVTGTLEDSGQANPDNNFRFDPTLGQTGGYIFNLKTTGFASGTYRVTFAVGEQPVQHSVQFQVR